VFPSLKGIGVTTLTFWGHVTSSVTWPLDLQYGVSYRWSIKIDRLSRTYFKILSSKGIGVKTLTFGVTWRHRSCDHWIPNVWFPIGSQYELTMYLARLSRYWASKISGSRLWPFGVTWRHLSRDHWIRNMGFPLDGQLEPTVYLAGILSKFLRYKASNVLGSRLSPLRSHDVIGHVITWFSMCGFLLVVNRNWPRISHGCREIELQRYMGHDLNLLGSRDVICHVTIGFVIWGFL